MTAGVSWRAFIPFPLSSRALLGAGGGRASLSELLLVFRQSLAQIGCFDSQSFMDSKEQACSGQEKRAEFRSVELGRPSLVPPCLPSRASLVSPDQQLLSPKYLGHCILFEQTRVWGDVFPSLHFHTNAPKSPSCPNSCSDIHPASQSILCF